MRRRELIMSLGGAIILSTSPGGAQQVGPVRRVGILTAQDENNSAKANFAAFQQSLDQLGWSEGRNLRIDYRWAAGDPDRTRKFAAELAALAPDVILATGSAVERALEVTRTVPIVFVNVPDPVGAGLVDSLSRPGGNATGFMQFEYSLCAKWPELLKQIAPGVTRAAILRDPAVTAGIGQFAVIQSVAPALGIEVSPISVRDAATIERGVGAFARFPNGSLIRTASALVALHTDLIIELASRYKLPTISSNPATAAAGGLISYGANLINQFRLAAGYVDRILKGAKPADLPIQAPTKYELSINLKTAKALGLTVPLSLLARADELIE